MPHYLLRLGLLVIVLVGRAVIGAGAFVMLLVAVDLRIAIAAGEASFSIVVPRTQTPTMPRSGADWPVAAAQSFGWDFTNGQAATESTDVRIAADGSHLYVRFAVRQREPAASTSTASRTG